MLHNAAIPIVKLREFKKENNYHEISKLYDLMYASRIKDIHYFINLIQDKKIKGPILELGCGTGRVLLALALKFPRVKFVGVDILEEYLEYCKTKIVAIQNLFMALNKRFPLLNVDLHLGDMCQLNKVLSPTLKFQMIILCNSTFLHIKYDKDRVSLFENIKKFLSSHGFFLLEYTPLPIKSNKWEERESVSGYKIFRMNKVYKTGKVHRFYKFEQTPPKRIVAKFQATLYPISDLQIRKLCESHQLEIKEEKTCFPLEKKGSRRIYLIGHRGERKCVVYS